MDKKLGIATQLNSNKLNKCSGNNFESIGAHNSDTRNNAANSVTTSSPQFVWNNNQITKEFCKRSRMMQNNDKNNDWQQRNTLGTDLCAPTPKIVSGEDITEHRLSSKTGTNINHRNNSNITADVNSVFGNRQEIQCTKAKECIASPVNKFTAINAKVTNGFNKNEEAIHDLCTRIPEIEKIFDIRSRVGNGTFSTVLLGTLKKERDLPESQKRKFAIKHHVPTSHPDRIMKELQCMAKIGGSDNVVGINCCIRYNESVAFVMPYLAHDRFHDFYHHMDLTEIQFYLQNLLVALRHVHRFNVIHRDVKPSNFLYNRGKRQFLLVDFGLAQQVPSSYMEMTYSTANKMPNSTLLTLANMHCESKRTRDADECEQKKIQNDLLNKNTAKKLCFSGPQGGKQFTHEGSKVQPISNKTHLSERHQGGAHLTSNTATRVSNSTTLMMKTGLADNVPESKHKVNRSLKNMNKDSKCYCYGNPQVCNICLVKKEICASRAGTPGYRPPEVLLKYSDQTTAVDIWAVGVIFLSILSSVYPFFKAPNDYVALAEMVTIFGDKVIRKTAFSLDRLVTLSQRTKPLDLRKLCVRFRNRNKFSSPELLKKYQRSDGTCEVCNNCDQFFFNCLCLESKYITEPIDANDPFPASAYDLLYKLLEINPHKRITAEQALKHPFFQ